MQKRIKLRYAQNEMAVLEQTDDSTKTRIWISLDELRAIVEFLKNPTDAPFVFYNSKYPDPLCVRFNFNDNSYLIERGESVLSGVRGGKEDDEEVEEEPKDSRGNAFKIFKKFMTSLAGEHEESEV